MNVDEAPGSPAAPVNPFEDMPIEQIQDAEREIDRLHEQHMNGGLNNSKLKCAHTTVCPLMHPQLFYTGIFQNQR